VSASRIGVGAMGESVTAAASVTAAYPAAYSATLNDYAVFTVVGKPTADTTGVPTAPTGYTQIATQRRTGQPICIVQYARVLDGSEGTAPTVTVPSTDGWANLLTCYLTIYRGVDPANPQDVSAQTTSAGANTQFAAAGITPGTDGAMIVTTVGTPDDNAIGLLLGSEQGFSLVAGGASYDTTTGTDCANGQADKIQTVAGPVTMPTFEETQVGTDPWVNITMALRPATVAGTTAAAAAIIEGY
jgi:hypothetical protein